LRYEVSGFGFAPRGRQVVGLSTTWEDTSPLKFPSAVSRVIRVGPSAHVQPFLTRYQAKGKGSSQTFRELRRFFLVEERTRASEPEPEASLKTARADLSEPRERLKTMALLMEDSLLSDISSQQRSLEISDDTVRRLEGPEEAWRLALENAATKRGGLKTFQTKFVAEAQRPAGALEESNGRVQKAGKKLTIAGATKEAERGNNSTNR
jgi:hypothetical protein